MRERLPWVLLTLTGLLVLVMLSLSLGREPFSDTLLYGLLALTFATTGALVASRQQANPIGWVFCAFGVWGGLIETWEAFAYHSLPTGGAGEWVISWSWICDLAVYSLIFLLFPTGRLVTRRWRAVIWLLVAGCILAIPGQALNPDNTEFAGGSNPTAVDSVAVQVAFYAGIGLVLAGLIASVASLMIRYRRASGIERLQLKQFVFAGSVIIAVMVVAVPFYYDSAAVRLAVGVALAALPVAVGIAILRYRLYDIDVVVNRALVYGALTATLAGAYLGLVLLLQLALSPLTEESDLAVAGSTLAVAALFRPARARIQALVDRRFFRRRYDAGQTLERFGVRLRDEVDLDALGGELRTVVGDAMQPAHVSLWLRAPGAGR
jgi:hypothetical protein